MVPTAAPVAEPPVRPASAADPLQLAAELEQAVSSLPPAERQSVLARLVALAAEPGPASEPPVSDPAPNLDELTDEMFALEARFPPPAPGETDADSVWLRDRWGTPDLEPYRGKWVGVLNGRVVAADPNPILLRVEWSRQNGRHPSWLVMTFVPEPCW